MKTIFIILTFFLSFTFNEAQAKVLECNGNEVVMIENIEEDVCTSPCDIHFGNSMSPDGIVEFYYCSSGPATF